MHNSTATEFVHVVQGTMSLAFKDGHEEKFVAGDNFLIPRGNEAAWKATDRYEEYWVEFDPKRSDPASAETDPPVIRFDRNGTAGKGLAGTGRTKEYQYYSSPEKSSADVWDTKAFTAPDFHTPDYSELMVFLDGSVTLSTPTVRPRRSRQDVALVPKAR
jgi:uncharacterized cupin superfamily protein